MLLLGRIVAIDWKLDVMRACLAQLGVHHSAYMIAPVIADWGREGDETVYWFRWRVSEVSVIDTTVWGRRETYQRLFTDRQGSTLERLHQTMRKPHRVRYQPKQLYSPPVSSSWHSCTFFCIISASVVRCSSFIYLTVKLKKSVILWNHWNSIRCHTTGWN